MSDGIDFGNWFNKFSKKIKQLREQISSYLGGDGGKEQKILSPLAEPSPTATPTPTLDQFIKTANERGYFMRYPSDIEYRRQVLGEKVTPTPQPTEIPTQTQTQTPISTNIPPQTAAPTPIPWQVKDLPPEKRPYYKEIAKAWGEAAPIAHKILRYVDPKTGEVKGENTSYKAGKEMDIPNPDGTIDRGLFRINSATFNDFMRRKKRILNQEGIYSWDDMLDPFLNAKMAKIIFDEQGGRAWYAAPPEIRRRANR